MKCIAAVLLLAATTLTAAPVTVTLTLPRTAVLPGVPFDMLVTFTNHSDHAIAIGRTAIVTVTPANGEPVRMERFAHVDSSDASINDSNVELQPGETRAGYLSWDANWLWDDAAVTLPGTYDIALELSGRPDAVDDGVTYVGTVRSTTARLVRIEPVGEDAVVWRRLQEAANGKWPSHGFGSRATRDNLAAEVIASHPNSAYYPYAVVLSHDEPPLAVIRDAADRFKESAAYPHVLVTAAVAACGVAQRRATERSVADTEQLLQLAVSYSDAATQTGNLAVRDHSRVVRDVAKSELNRLHGAHAREQ